MRVAYTSGKNAVSCLAGGRDSAVNGKRPFASLLLASVFLGGASIAAISAAEAQQAQTVPSSASINFSIPAQPLASAISAFIKKTGWQISYSSALASGKTSAAVVGSFTPSQALQQLVAGTGVEVRSGSPGSAALVDPNAAGNDAGATVDGAIALDTIDVSGGGSAAQAAADLPYQTPGTSSFISAEQIERIAPSRPGDVFNNTPGVIAASKNSGGSVDVNIRGLQGMNRVKVMVDGTQQESATYRSYNGTDNRSYFDPDLLSGVVIEKGPGDGPYGSGAMGGVVNMQTITPDDILLPGASYGLRIRGGIGDNTAAPSFNPPGARPPDAAPDFFDIGSNRNGSVAVAAVTEHFDFVAAASKREHGNYFAGKYGPETYPSGNASLPFARYSQNLPEEEVPNTSEDTTSTLLKGTLKFDDHALELGYMHQDSEFGYSFPLWAQQASRQQFFLSPTESNRYTAKYKYRPQDNDLIDLHVNAWATDLNTEEPYQRVVGQYQTLIDSKAHGGEAWNTSQFATLVGRATVSYGAEYSFADFSGFGQNLNAAPYLKTRGTRELAGTFVRSKLDVTDWLAVNGGLRYDRYRTEAAPGTNSLTKNEGEAVLPSGGLAVTPWAGIQFFGKYAEGYRPPAIQEIAGTGGESSGWVGPNPDLRPEESENWEFGLNVLRRDVVRNDDKLRIKAAYFDNRYNDYIAPGGLCPAGGICFTNYKQAEFKGYELSADYDARTFFASASFNYYTKADVGSDPYDVMYQWGMGYVPPKMTVAGTIGVRLLDEKLTLGVHANYTGERASPYMYLPPYSTVRFTPNVTTVGLFGSYQVNDNISTNFSIENLTDQFYVDPLAVTAIPSPGRTMRLGFEMKLGEPGSIDDGGIALPQLTTPRSGYDWSGVFAGLDGGYSLGAASARGDVAGTIRTGSSSTGYVMTPYTSATNTEYDPSALTAGVFAGYNLQLSSLVLGADASFAYPDPMFNSEQFVSPAVYTQTGRTITTKVASSMEWQAAVRGRVGVAFDRTLPYIAAGVAAAGYSYDYTSFTLVGPAGPVGSNRTLPDPMRLKGTYVGWTLGAGVEHAMTDYVILRAEYNHSDFGKETFETPYGPHQVDITSDEWKLGAAYKF